MIEVLRGSTSRLRSEILDRFHRRPEESLWFESPEASPRSFDAVRRLLVQIHPRLDETVWAGCVTRYRPAVELVLDRLAHSGSLPAPHRAPLSDDQRQAQAELRARLDSYLSHNWTLQRPLIEAWAGFLADLCAGRGWTLCVPHLAQVDWESHAVLAALYRLHLDRAPKLVVGFDPSHRSVGVDERGIRWGKVPAEQLYLAGLGFHMRPEAEVRSLEARGSERGDDSGERPEDDPRSPVSAPDPSWVEGAETTVFHRLASGEPPDGASIAAALAAMEACFARFAFTTVLRLGVELLDRGVRLEPAAAARFHGLLGLSAHNRQFRSGGNRELEPFLEDQFRRAYALERDPGRRIAVCYRLAVTFGRRMGRIEPAIEWADRGIELSRSASLPRLERVRHEAWCLNIRAFLWMRSGRLEDAIADDVRAFELLREAEAERAAASEAWPRELSSTQGVLAHNTAALYTLARDLERVGHWRAEAGEIEKDHPGTETWEAHAWIGYCRQELRLDEALSRAESGLASARAEREPFHEYHYTLMLADLSYRLGEAERALRWFDRAGELRDRCGNPDYLVSPRLSAAWAAFRTGRYDDAVSRFESVLADGQGLGAGAAVGSTAGSDPALRVELLGALGEIEALRGRADRAEERINEAISLAVETGERDLLLRAAIAAGAACRALGRTEEAVAAYRQALDLAALEDESGETEIGQDAAPAPAGEVLRALVALAELESELEAEKGPGRRERVRQALAVLEPALRQDADAWWCVPALARLATCTEDRSGDPQSGEDDELASARELLDRVARQRHDGTRDVQAASWAAAG